MTCKINAAHITKVEITSLGQEVLSVLSADYALVIEEKEGLVVASYGQGKRTKWSERTVSLASELLVAVHNDLRTELFEGEDGAVSDAGNFLDDVESL